MHCKQVQNEYFVPLGAGRFYDKNYLEQINYLIFDETLDSCLDDYGYFTIKNLKEKIHFYTPEDGALLSVKGDWNHMNSVNGIIQSDAIEVTEFSIEGLPKFEKELSRQTKAYLFGDNNKSVYEYSWTKQGIA
jgi:hypothetical protein